MDERTEQQRIADVLRQAVVELETAGVTEARLDAELLLGSCLGKGRTELYLAARETVAADAYRSFQLVLERRKSREPVAYILGEKEFWSLPFYVSPAVLIPRPETEFLLATVLARRNPLAKPGHGLDLCCGSGVIAVVLARECLLTVTAVDIVADALAVARSNCQRHGVLDRVALVQADLASCFRDGQPFSLIVSNPPYIPRDEIENGLEPEVARYEPRLALDGGRSGLAIINRICGELPSLLATGGDCFLEIGEGQGDHVRAMFADQGYGAAYAFVTIIKDYAGRDRVAHIRKA